MKKQRKSLEGMILILQKVQMQLKCWKDGKQIIVKR